MQVVFRVDKNVDKEEGKAMAAGTQCKEKKVCNGEDSVLEINDFILDDFMFLFRTTSNRQNLQQPLTDEGISNC